MTHSIDRRLLLAGLLAAAASPAAAAALSPADKALVDKATAYLQGLTGAKGRFVQTDPRGIQTQGTFYLQRPGKARFAYDAPSAKLLVSDGNIVAESDTRLKTVSRYPLGSTPLAMFLSKNIRLDKGINITRVARLSGGFAITLQEGRSASRGSLTLNFSDNPVGLLGWVINTPQGPTRVQLVGLQRATGLDPKLFAVPAPPRRTGKSNIG